MPGPLHLLSPVKAWHGLAAMAAACALIFSPAFLATQGSQEATGVNADDSAMPLLSYTELLPAEAVFHVQGTITLPSGRETISADFNKTAADMALCSLTTAGGKIVYLPHFGPPVGPSNGRLPPERYAVRCPT